VPQLFRVDTEGQGLTQITSGPVSATAPSVTRDGKHIVYVQLGHGIFSASIDGSGERRLTAGVRDSYPVISANGKRIAFLRPQRAQWRVYTMSSTGRNERRLPKAPPAGRPSWSENGKSLFVSSAGDLVKIDSVSGKVQKYYDMRIDIQAGQTVTVSPGAKMVSFVGPRTSTGPEDCGDSPCPQFGLYLENVAKPHHLRRIVNDTGPAGWSPDGTHIVFVSRGALTLMDVTTKAKSAIPLGTHVATGDAAPAWFKTG